MMTVPILIFSIILVITSVALALFVLMTKAAVAACPISSVVESLPPLVGRQSQNEISTDSPSSSEWSGSRQSWRSACSTSWVPDCPQPPAGRSTQDTDYPQLGRAREKNVAGGSAIRGSRVGAGPMGEAERGDAAPRLYVSYYCAHGHETGPLSPRMPRSLKPGIVPDAGCRRTSTRPNPPPPPKIEPYKTHLAYVKERHAPTRKRPTS